MKGTICERSYESQYAFLEDPQTLTLSEFLILGSKLFHPIIVEGKTEFLKSSCLTLKRGTLFLCLVIYVGLAVDINSQRYFRG